MFEQLTSENAKVKSFTTLKKRTILVFHLALTFPLYEIGSIRIGLHLWIVNHYIPFTMAFRTH